MREINLTRNQVALVDDEDYERVVAMGKWQATWCEFTGTFYATLKKARQKTIGMHRFIYGATDCTIKVDHRNHDTLDNRKRNLRSATQAENGRNRLGANKNSTTGLRGVTIHRPSGRFIAQLMHNRKNIHLGYHLTKEAARAARLAGERIYYGEFAEQD